MPNQRPINRAGRRLEDVHHVDSSRPRALRHELLRGFVREGRERGHLRAGRGQPQDRHGPFVGRRVVESEDEVAGQRPHLGAVWLDPEGLVVSQHLDHVGVARDDRDVMDQQHRAHHAQEREQRLWVFFDVVLELLLALAHESLDVRAEPPGHVLEPRYEAHSATPPAAPAR